MEGFFNYLLDGRLFQYLQDKEISELISIWRDSLTKYKKEGFLN